MSEISDYTGGNFVSKGEKAVLKIRNQLIKELNDDVTQRFEGNKTAAAAAAKISRSQFTGICNGTERVGIDKLVEIGTNLGWNIHLIIQRKEWHEK